MDVRVTMKDIKPPAFMQEAARESRGHLAFLEILIALLVFLVSSLVMSVGQVPALFVYLFRSDTYLEMLRSGRMNMNAIMDLISNMPEWIMILMLCLEILMIAIVILYCRFLEHRKIRTMGFQKKGMVRQYLLGALGGIAFFGVAYLLCLITGSIRLEGVSSEIVPGYIIGYLIGYLIQGMAEEVLCRGYLFVSLSRRYSVIYSAVLSAVFFALLHGMNAGLSFVAVFNIFLFGIFAALLLVRFENIWIVGAFHSLWNFAQGNLFGIQVSGNEVQNSLLSSVNQPNMGLLNGGKFGMEGGLCVTLVLVLGIAWLIGSLGRTGKIVDRPIMQSATVQMPQQQSTREVHQVRENMGTDPGETPWRPTQPESQKAETTTQGEAMEEKQRFDANYFKD